MLVAGDRAPVVVTEDMVRSMRPGSVVVDVAIDQGGCVATSRETSHHDPTFVVHGVVHYAVGNIPGAVPHTSTHALTNATLPHLRELARLGVDEACRRDPALARGLNTRAGEVVNPAVAHSLGREPGGLAGDEEAGRIGSEPASGHGEATSRDDLSAPVLRGQAAPAAGRGSWRRAWRS